MPHPTFMDQIDKSLEVIDQTYFRIKKLDELLAMEIIPPVSGPLPEQRDKFIQDAPDG